VREQQVAPSWKLRAERDGGGRCGAERAHAWRRIRRRQPAGAVRRGGPRRATVGEMSDAMEKVFGRHRAEIKAISGVYKREVGTMAKPSNGRLP
jgi:methylmalonyl-CoA mutase